MTPVILIGLGVIIALFLLTVLRGAPYVPSHRSDVDKAFGELYSLTPFDKVVDIGSGDGVVLRVVAQHGATGIGYEINPVLVLISKFLCRRYSKITIVAADFWRAKLPTDTTLVYTFGDRRDIEKMANWVQQQATRIGKPLYFMSYAFRLSAHQPQRSNRSHFLYLIEPLQD